MSLPAPVAAKISKLIPRLASEHDPEIVGTVRAIVRVLAAEKLDLHDLAKALEPLEAIAMARAARPSRPAGPAPYEPAPEPPRPSPRPKKSPERPTTAAWNGARRSAQHAWISFILSSDGFDQFDRPLIEQIDAFFQRGQMFDLKRGEQNRLYKILERFPFDTDV